MTAPVPVLVLNIQNVRQLGVQAVVLHIFCRCFTYWREIMADAKTSPYGQWLRVIWVAHHPGQTLTYVLFWPRGCLPPPSTAPAYRGHMFNKYSVAYQVSEEQLGLVAESCENSRWRADAPPLPNDAHLDQSLLLGQLLHVYVRQLVLTFRRNFSHRLPLTVYGRLIARICQNTW